MTEAEARIALAAFDRAAIPVVAGEGGLAAAHVPVQLAPDQAHIIGHLARANPIWRAAPCRALLVCTGPKTYVSPGWYATKTETGRTVPTWNYETVHVHGTLGVFDDPVRLRALVASLSDVHEAGRAHPWSIDDAPGDYVEAMLRGFVGFELAIDRVEGKRKLSQDKPEKDRAGVIAALEESADPRDRAVASKMRETKTQSTLRPPHSRTAVVFWMIALASRQRRDARRERQRHEQRHRRTHDQHRRISGRAIWRASHHYRQPGDEQRYRIQPRKRQRPERRRDVDGRREQGRNG
jgi:transcriptional regulator